MPNIEYRGHVTLPVAACSRYDGFGTINGVHVCRCGEPAAAHKNRIPLQPTCAECGRIFDLCDTVDVEEWTYGHDCEN